MMVDPNYTRGLAQAISQASATEQTLTTQLSSGLRVTSLADDPVAVATNVGLSSTISGLDSFVKISTAEQSRLQVADNALGEVVTQVTHAVSLAVSASGGTLSAENLASVQTQLASIRNTVLGLGNTSYQGQYVFSGSQGTTTPFTLDTTTDPASATYHGDAVTQQTETPDGQKVSTNVPGSNIFTSANGNLLGALNQLISDVGSGDSADIQTDASALTQALGQVTVSRATLDSSLSRIATAGTYASSQETVYQAQQSTLLSADPAAIATSLKTAEVQQQALLGVTAALEGAKNLFDYL